MRTKDKVELLRAQLRSLGTHVDCLQRRINCGASKRGHVFKLQDVSIEQWSICFLCDCGQHQYRNMNDLTDKEKAALRTFGINLGESNDASH